MSTAFSAVPWPVSSQGHGHGGVLFWHYVTSLHKSSPAGEVLDVQHLLLCEQGATSALKTAGLMSHMRNRTIITGLPTTTYSIPQSCSTVQRENHPTGHCYTWNTEAQFRQASSMVVDGFHLMCLADPEPASSVLSTTHLPKPCSHAYISDRQSHPGHLAVRMTTSSRYAVD